MKNVHPLIELAETIPLEGDPRDKLCRTANGMWDAATGDIRREQMGIVSAMTLAEYILAKRQQAGPSIFPIPDGGKKITVRAKGPTK